MKTWVRKRKARGFTLVELLIVIVIIGILAGSMLLVFGSATDSAKATRVISEMRALKAAAMMYYADNNDWPAVDEEEEAFNAALKKYMDRAEPASGEYATYSIVKVENGSLSYVTGDDTDTTGEDAPQGYYVKAVINNDEGGVATILGGGKGAEAGLAKGESNDFYMILEATEED